MPEQRILGEFDIAAIPDPRVKRRVAQAGTCWIWYGSLNNNGYGHFVRRAGPGKQKKSYVHRYTYTLFKGPIGPGQEIHHTCYNRSCCNPEHLTAVSHAMNCAYNRQFSQG